MIKVELGLRIREFDERVAKKIIPRAAARTANRVIGKARADARKALRKDRHTQVDLLKGFVIQPAKAGPLATASLVPQRNGLPLIELNPDIVEIQTRRGLRLGVAVTVNGRRVVVPGAFLAQLRAGAKPGVYRRVGDARFPIKSVRASEVLGGSVAGLLADEKVQAVMRASVEANFKQAFKDTFDDLASKVK